MALIGEAISGVCFVTSYVEFHFSGAILRALSNPELETNGRSIRFGEVGSRDALCSVIGAEVEDVRIVEESQIELVLTSGQIVRIPLDEGSRPAYEAAHFVPGPDEPMEVW